MKRSQKKTHFPEGVRLGILGGGQLGRMLIRYGMDFNIKPIVLDPDPKCPAHDWAFEFVSGSLEDYETVTRFGRMCDLVTVEMENVNSEALAQLEKENIPVFPQSRILNIIQDKGRQKTFFKKKGFPTAPFFLVENQEELKAKVSQFPKVIKLCRSGYDGRGVKKLTSPKDLKQSFNAPCIVEDFIPIKKEISVLVCRSLTGECVSYPAVEQVFHPTKNILQYLRMPADLPQDLEKKAENLAKKIACELKIVGLLAVEMFIDENEKIFVNELSPRPHNSGHHTMEANETSQYEQLLRSLLKLPLGDTSPRCAAVMINLLGKENFYGKPKYYGIYEALALPGVHVHLYGKTETRPFRKMGHITITAGNLEEAEKKAKKILQWIEVRS